MGFQTFFTLFSACFYNFIINYPFSPYSIAWHSSTWYILVLDQVSLNNFGGIVNQRRHLWQIIIYTLWYFHALTYNEVIIIWTFNHLWLLYYLAFLLQITILLQLKLEAWPLINEIQRSQVIAAVIVNFCFQLQYRLEQLLYFPYFNFIVLLASQKSRHFVNSYPMSEFELMFTYLFQSCNNLTRIAVHHLEINWVKVCYHHLSAVL